MTDPNQEPNHEANEPQEWSEWVQAWQSDDEVTLPSLEETRERVKRKERNTTRQLIMELLASLAVVVFHAIQLSTGKASAPIIAVAVATLVFVCIWMVQVFRTAFESYKAPGESVQEHLLYMINQVQAQVRFLNFSDKALWVVLGFFCLWGPWMFWRYAERYFKKPMAAVIGFGGVLVIWLFLWAYNRRQRRKLNDELQALQETQQDMFAED